MKIYSPKDFNNSLREKCLKIISYRNKYDIIANEISREIFQSVVKKQAKFNKEYPIYNISIEATIEDINEEYIEEVKGHVWSTFVIKSYNEGYFLENNLNNVKITISVSLSNSFSNKDYSVLNNKIYEIIRHELEHRENYINVGKPSEEYQDIFNSLFINTNARTLKEHCQIMSQYVLDPQELPSYAKSILYVAKKTKTPYQSIIQQVIGRVFYNNRIDNGILSQKDSETEEIVANAKNILSEEVNKLLSIRGKTKFNFI